MGYPNVSLIGFGHPHVRRRDEALREAKWERPGERRGTAGRSDWLRRRAGNIEETRNASRHKNKVERLSAINLRNLKIGEQAARGNCCLIVNASVATPYNRSSLAANVIGKSNSGRKRIIGVVGCGT